MNTHTLEVRLHDRRAGTLTRQTNSALIFQYDETYVADRSAPPLSTGMPVRSAPYGPKPTEAWFDGLLAEGRRRAHLARIVAAASLDTWSLLRAAGGECAGAVQIVGPEHTDRPDLFPLNENVLTQLLASPPVEPVGTISRAARISLAGAQDKIALYRTSHGHWAVPTGGHPSTHILKPQSSQFEGLVENEHFCMTLARAAGLPAATTSIETIGMMQVLVVERYDRTRLPDGSVRRIHQEDLAQALGARAKYQSDGGPSTYALFEVPGVARAALFEHLMFSWLVGNCDAHAKNYSILEPGTPRARLAPVYDMLCTECYEGLDTKLATRIGRADRLNAVTRQAVETMGTRVGFAPGEASTRLHAFAERIRDALAHCKTQGIPQGPVNTNRITARIEQAFEWA